MALKYTKILEEGKLGRRELVDIEKSILKNGQITVYWRIGQPSKAQQARQIRKQPSILPYSRSTMDKKKITAIYLELSAQESLLTDRAHKSDDATADALWVEIGKLKSILFDLEEIANKRGIYLASGMRSEVEFEVNENDDWQQLLETANLGSAIKAALKARLESLSTPPKATLVWPVINTVDKYYEANVRNADNMRILERQTKVLGTRKLEPNVDGIKIHQGVALQVLKEAIDNLTEDLQMTIDDHLHPRFVVLYRQAIIENSKGKHVTTVIDGIANADKSITDKIEDATEATAQYKKTLKETTIDTFEGFSAGPFVFRNWILNGSVKVDYSTKAHLLGAVIDDSCDRWVNFHAEAFRRTIALDGMLNQFGANTYSITPLSAGIQVFKWKYGEVQLKSEVKGIKLTSLSKQADAKGAIGELFIMNLRFQVTIFLLETPPIRDANLALPNKIQLQRAVATLSLGCTLNLDIPKARAIIQKVAKAAKKVGDAVGDVAEAYKDISQKTKVLREKMLAETDQVKDLVEAVLDKKKPNRDLVKKVTEQFKKHSDEFKETLAEFAKKSTAAKEAAEKLLVETSEAVAKKLGPKVLGFMAKVGGRAIPVVGQVMMVYDIASTAWAFSTGLYNLYNTVQSSNLSWEQQVENWLLSWK